jgi:hypothetical protein
VVAGIAGALDPTLGAFLNNAVKNYTTVMASVEATGAAASAGGINIALDTAAVQSVQADILAFKSHPVAATVPAPAGVAVVANVKPAVAK